MTEPVEQIRDDDLLYRRLAPSHVNPDGSVNSAAFKVRNDYDTHISVDLARLTTPEKTLAPRPGFGLGSLGFKVRHDPLRENPAHALIEGENSRAKSRLLAEAMTLVIKPQQ